MVVFFLAGWVLTILQQTAPLFLSDLSGCMVHLIPMTSCRRTVLMRVDPMSASAKGQPKHIVSSMRTASRVDLNTFFQKKEKNLQPMRMYSQARTIMMHYTTPIFILQVVGKKQEIYNNRSLVTEPINL